MAAVHFPSLGLVTIRRVVLFGCCIAASVREERTERYTSMYYFERSEILCLLFLVSTAAVIGNERCADRSRSRIDQKCLHACFVEVGFDRGYIIC